MNERGASLVEVSTVSAIMAVVMGISLPGWASLVGQRHQRAVVAEIASELRTARQLAMARHERIRVVVDAAQSELRTECVACESPLLRRYAFAHRGTRIESMTTKPEILFQPSGRSAGATTIHVVGRRQASHQVTVGISGRVAWI